MGFGLDPGSVFLSHAVCKYFAANLSELTRKSETIDSQLFPGNACPQDQNQRARSERELGMGVISPGMPGPRALSKFPCCCFAVSHKFVNFAPMPTIVVLGEAGLGYVVDPIVLPGP